MKEIKRIPLSRLYKKEVPLLLESVIQILGKHNPENLHLQELYKLLELQMDKSQILLKSYGAHPLSNEIARLHKKRVSYATLINMQLKSLSKVDCEKTQLMVKNAQVLSKVTLTYLGQKRQLEVQSKIGSFFFQLCHPEYADCKEAFVGLGLQQFLDEMEDANQQHMTLFDERKNERKKRSHSKDLVLEKEIQRLMQLFFEQVNYFQKFYTEIDYTSLIREFNVELTRNSKLLKTRVATNKRKAKKKKALAEKEAAAKAVKEQTASEAKAKVKPAPQSQVTPATNGKTKPVNNISDGANANGGIESEGKDKSNDSTTQKGAK